MQAGISVWMITGDKQATAIEIGYSCRLLKQDMDIVILNADSSEDCGEQLRSKVFQCRYLMLSPMAISNNVTKVNEFCTKKRKRDVAMVVDGPTLKYALAEHSSDFLKIASICFSVVACRVTPLQKVTM